MTIGRPRWIKYDTCSYAGIDEDGGPKYVTRKFYRCSVCRVGSAVQTPYCPYCGTKLDSDQNR